MNFKYFRGQLPLEGMDEIHNCESLPLGVFGVNDSIMDDILKEDLEDTMGLPVDQARDTLDTTTMHQTVDSGAWHFLGCYHTRLCDDY